jgi:hydrogenase-4 membrane subunit HyfE
MQSVAVSTVIVFLIAAASSVPYITPVGAILLPGMLLAALFFDTGIHSDHPNYFVILVAVFNILIFSVPVFLYLRRRRKLKTPTENETQ